MVRRPLGDLVDEWKQQALVLVRRKQRELHGQRRLTLVGFARAAWALIAAATGARTSVARLRQQAWAAIGKADPLLAHLAVQQLPRSQLTIELVAAYLMCCNRRDEAAALLLEARALGQRARETTKLLIELLVMREMTSDALELIRQDSELLLPDDLRALERVGVLTKLPGGVG